MSDQHEKFDAICAQIDEYEPLPEVTPGDSPAYDAIASSPEAQEDSLNEAILARLVHH